jgi:hypothetical protein
VSGAEIAGVLVTMPIRTKNPLNMSTGNSRLAGIIRGRMRAKQRHDAKLVVEAALRRRGLDGMSLAPWRVRVTRISPGRLDPHDGLGAALKGVIDGVAEALGIDDGDEARVRFVLQQRKGRREDPQLAKGHGVEILMMPRAGEARS